jgi:hypothetical protein
LRGIVGGKAHGNPRSLPRTGPEEDKKEPAEIGRLFLAETTGFEPATYGLTGRCANRYTTSPVSFASRLTGVGIVTAPN